MKNQFFPLFILFTFGFGQVAWSMQPTAEYLDALGDQRVVFVIFDSESDLNQWQVSFDALREFARNFAMYIVNPIAQHRSMSISHKERVEKRLQVDAPGGEVLEDVLVPFDNNFKIVSLRGERGDR